jgi:hypothetical protein
MSSFRSRVSGLSGEAVMDRGLAASIGGVDGVEGTFRVEDECGRTEVRVELAGLASGERGERRKSSA